MTEQPLFEPIFGKVVVKVENSNVHKRGSLFVPTPNVSLRTYGEVHAVYPATVEPGTGEVIEPQVKVGDKVLFGQYSGTEVSLGGSDYIIIREQDLLTIVHFRADEMDDPTRNIPKAPTIVKGGEIGEA